MTDAKGLSEVKRYRWHPIGKPPLGDIRPCIDGEYVKYDDYKALAERLKRVRPIPMALACPQCQTRHIDAGEWASRLHHVHRCALCGHEWDVEIYSVGVAETEAEQLKAVEKERDTQCALKHNLINRLEERTTDLAAMTKERDTWKMRVGEAAETVGKLEADLQRAQAEVDDLARMYGLVSAELKQAREEIAEIRTIRDKLAVETIPALQQSNERLKAAVINMIAWVEPHRLPPSEVPACVLAAQAAIKEAGGGE